MNHDSGANKPSASMVGIGGSAFCEWSGEESSTVAGADGERGAESLGRFRPMKALASPLAELVR